MSSIRKANAALAAAVIFLLLSSAAAYLAFGRLHTSQLWVSHTRDVQSALGQFAVVASRAGRLRAEFADSGDLSLLQQQADVVRDLRNAMDSIQHLTADNTAQQDECAQLRNLVEQRIALMDQSIELKKSGQSTLQTQAPITRQIVATAAETDQVLQHMYDSEERLRSEREVRLRRSSAATVWILITSSFMALILFLVDHRLLTQQVMARTRAETAQRAISARLLTLQDEERRKFARELHDSVGQHLAAMKMGISMLQSKLPGDSTLKDCTKLLDDSISETRTISHLLHPPLLDEAGLNSAVRWFVDGFGRRSGIETKLDIRDGKGRLPASIEIVLFRVLQESLTNVHRHSGTKRAEIFLNTAEDIVVLRVKDYGTGMPAQVLQSLSESGTSASVGLAGMTERIREIGGRLDIKSNSLGTEIAASVAVHRRLVPAHLSNPATREAVE